MPPAVSALASRFAATDGLFRKTVLCAGVLAALHITALAILIATESAPVPWAAFLLFWGLLNLTILALVARPLIAAALSLGFISVLILLSQLKHDILLMTVNFIDLMMIDRDTFTFLMKIFPQLGAKVAVAGALAVVALGLMWFFDPFRIRRLAAAIGALACFGALIALSLSVPSDPWEEFYAENYVSKFARSGVTAVGDLMTRGILESDALVGGDGMPGAADATCTVNKPPHIIMVFDESSFDIRAIPEVKVPAGYGAHFKSSDGKQRALTVEGAGGPSWFTEYNVLTGLSARSYGRFADFVTRIAAGRVERGLPQTLRKCGYKTTTLYPMYGAFLSARHFQETTGIQSFLDSQALGAQFLNPDSFYLDKAADAIKQHGKDPQFILVYTAQNHFPWTFRFRPDLAPDWRDLGNRPDVDEYLRRQHMSAVDYQAFEARLKREFPNESFLIVRFGDHQPYFARNMIDPGQDDSMIARHIAAADPRFLTTYYAINTINFTPRDLSSAVDAIDAPYLPLIVLEAAGVPLDASFAEQKRILQRCKGLFYRCHGGAEARRFNRLLIEAGLIKGL